MPDQKTKGEDFFTSLKEFLEIEKCRECECLHGALMQLHIDMPELKEVVARLLSGKVQKCRGCKPCPPADEWERYLKDK